MPAPPAGYQKEWEEWDLTRPMRVDTRALEARFGAPVDLKWPEEPGRRGWFLQLHPDDEDGAPIDLFYGLFFELKRGSAVRVLWWCTKVNHTGAWARNRRLIEAAALALVRQIAATG